jgi:hypothetical protein
MTVQEMVAQLGLQVFSNGNMERTVTGGYASDLLSCVMGRARAGNVWVTLQAHLNVVAVASLLDLAAVIVAEGIPPDEEMLERAKEKGVVLLGSPRTTFTVVGQMSARGIEGGD